MKERVQNFSNIFFLMVVCVLVITAIGKFLSSFGRCLLLTGQDHVTGITFRWLFRLAAGWEMAMAIIILIGKSPIWRALWTLATCNVLILYRFVSSMLGGSPLGCNCIGLLPNWFSLRYQTISTILLIFLYFSIFGAIIILLSFLSKESKQKHRPTDFS